MKTKLVEIVGWYATTAFLLAYFLVSLKIINAGIIFQLLNITGAVSMIIFAINKKIYQSAVLNLVWLIIGLIAAVKLFF